MKTVQEEYPMQSLAWQATIEAHEELRLLKHCGDGWVVPMVCPDIDADFTLYRIIPKDKPTMKTIQDGNPPVNPTRYTKELHLQHVQAFWDGNLEQFDTLVNSWEKPEEPPCAQSHPKSYRIKKPQQLRPWKPEEIPLGAWLREKNHQATSLIVAQMQGFVVWYAISGERVAGSPKRCLDTCEHSTDNGKTWLPCGVSE